MRACHRLVWLALAFGAACSGPVTRSPAGEARPPAEPTSAATAADQTCQGKPADLIDENYPSAAAGDDGYEYHQTATGDLNGDGVEETVHVIARAVKDGSGYSWDDGSPWHVYVDEPTGERTYVHSGWVQLGVLEVAVIARNGPGANLLIQHEGGAGYILYCAEYGGPGRARGTEIAEFAVNSRAASGR